VHYVSSAMDGAAALPSVPGLPQEPQEPSSLEDAELARPKLYWARARDRLKLEERERLG
jgi:hypothetical protein